MCNHETFAVKKLLELAETCFVVIGFTFFTGGLTLGGSEDGTSAGLLAPPLVTAIRYSIWLISSLLLLVNWKKTLYTASRDWLLWVVMGLTLVSFAWSDLSEWVFWNEREVLQMISFGLYFATRFTLRQQVRLLALSLMVGGFASMLFAIGMPSVGKHGADHPGAWKGIYDYKNTFGSMMVLGAVTLFLLPIERPIERVLRWVGLAFCVVLILLTTSKTALVVLCAMTAMLTFYRKFRWQGKLSVILLDLGVLVMGCVTTVLLNTWVDVVKGLGKDPTLSGRTYIWQVVGFHFWEKPWFGFGRGAFWAPESRYPSTAALFFGDQYVPPHAHNGFIDTALDIGLVGLALFLICFVVAYLQALRRAYAPKYSEDLFPLAFLTFLALNNMTESYLLRLSNVYLVLFISTTLTLRRRWQLDQDEDREENLSLPKYGNLQISKDQT